MPTEPAGASMLPLNGGSNAPLMNGNDPEDGTYTGNTGTVRNPKGVVISSLPTNGELWYDGVKVEISNVTNGTLYEDPSKFSIKFTGNNYTTTTFQYAYVDAAGIKDPSPANYTLSWTTPVSITLSSFDAYIKGNTVALEWITENEKNNKGYDIERSNDGVKWKSLAFVKTNANNGNSTSDLSYQFTDYNPAVGKNIYRLKQIDFDGQSTLSATRMVIMEANNNYTIYPNPAKDQVRIEGLQGNEMVTVVDVMGRKMFDIKITTPSQNIQLNAITEGVYYLLIKSADGKDARLKLIKQ